MPKETGRGPKEPKARKIPERQSKRAFANLRWRMQFWLVKGDVMRIRGIIEKYLRALVLVLVLMMAVPPGTFGQPAEQPGYKQEELDQILAPIALYPDSLLAQILMASTYPLEVVQADRWAKQNTSLKGDALTAALEKQPWDPSVKSLVNFPQVLSMMSEKLDWTQKLGDAFLAQQKDVMDTVQTLRKKAVEAGNLKTTQEQQVIVEKETIIIQSASPQVVYVPTYNPTVVYGAWPYPAYPPAYYYPPGYAAGTALFSFGVGMAVGAAWGYAWGNCNWHGGDVDVDINRNTNINNNINRGNYAKQYQGGGRGNWQHNPEHRKGVSYRDQATGQKYNRAATNEAVQSRENARGRTETGRQDMARGGTTQARGDQAAGQRGSLEGRAGTREAGARDLSGQGGSALSGMDRSGSATRDASSRGSSSRQSMSSGSRSGGFSGAASRGGGGGRGGGRR
jgi:uncharacterized membrane protein YgcG